VQLFLEGLLLGLTLTILLGPIFVALTQSSIEGGARAGLAVGSGVWFSDLTIIALCYFFIQRLSRIVEDSSFIYWMGLLGGIVLITFGIGTFLKKSSFDSELPRKKLSTKNYLSLFTKGFLVNTVNPFTFAFWIGVVSTYVLGRGISSQDATIFFGAILLVIISTDILKVVTAKLIRTRLKARHIDNFSKIAGVVLVVFGIVLLYKVAA